MPLRFVITTNEPIYPRLAVAGDAEAVTQCTRAAYAPLVVRIGREPKPMIADYRVAIRDHQVWIVDCGGVIGVLELIVEADHMLIENVAVLPAHQGQGHGAALLRHADAEARRQGFRVIRLYTNAFFVENIALYDRFGYQETGRAGVGMSRLVFMRKAL